MSGFSWFFVGLAVGSTLSGIAATIRLRAWGREREEYFAEARRSIDDLRVNTERRYAELRKRLGLPPREQEWS